MSDSKSSLVEITDIFGLGKIANSKAVERLTDAVVDGVGLGVGSLVRDWAMRRQVSAQLEVTKDALNQLPRDVDVHLELDGRARFRIERDADTRQHNRESIAEIALSNAGSEIAAARFESDQNGATISQDWLNNYWQRAELVSEEQMKVLWAKVLLRKAVSPQSFSIRSLNIVSQLSIDEAQMIEHLAPFVIKIVQKSEFQNPVGEYPKLCV